MNKEKILLIYPFNGWLNKDLLTEGYNLSYPYFGNCGFLRVIREIHFRYIKIAQKIWYNKKNNSFNGHIILNASLITPEYVKWLSKNNPQSKIILLYSNLANSKRYNPNKIPDSLCEKWTFDKDDSERYNMHLYEGGMYFPQWVVNKQAPVYDVFYIGKDKNRLQNLRKIESDLQTHGARTMFYITWSRGWQKKDDGIHKPFLPYEKVLDYIGKSKAILHLLDGAQKGITLRIQESLIHKVKLITDDSSLVEYDFYNPHNIFILGKDDLNNLRNFLDTPYENVQSVFFKHVFFNQMVNDIISDCLD